MGAPAPGSAQFNNNKFQKKYSQIPELGSQLLLVELQNLIETGKDDDDNYKDDDDVYNEILTIMGDMRIMML